MGQSTDALLMFGINLGEGEEIEWPAALVDGDEDSSYPDLEGYLAGKAGLVRPEGADYKAPEWAAYWAAKRTAEEACPVDLVSHCSGDYPMWILAVRRTVQRASRGYPITPVVDQIDHGEVQALRAFCDETGLPWSEPRWLLCSDWS